MNSFHYEEVAISSNFPLVLERKVWNHFELQIKLNFFFNLKQKKQLPQ
jgi:hypothetical protein